MIDGCLLISFNTLHFIYYHSIIQSFYLLLGTIRGRGHARRVSVGVPVRPSDLLLSQQESQPRLHPPTTGEYFTLLVFEIEWQKRQIFPSLLSLLRYDSIQFYFHTSILPYFHTYL